MEKYINEVLDECRIYIKGKKVANYIPELSKTNPDDLGISIYDMEGNYYSAGDFDTSFTDKNK